MSAGKHSFPTDFTCIRKSLGGGAMQMVLEVIFAFKFSQAYFTFVRNRIP